MTKNALAIRCLGATMPTGELLLSRRFSPQRVLQLFTLQLSTSPAPLYSRSETETRLRWVHNSQGKELQGFREKSQEHITMCSWLLSRSQGRSWSDALHRGTDARLAFVPFRCKVNAPHLN